MIEYRGDTKDGGPVVGKLYALYETRGLPLDVILDALQARGATPDWLDFWDSARAAGVKPKRLRTMIDIAVRDAYGRDHAVAVLRRLELLREEARL